MQKTEGQIGICPEVYFPDGTASGVIGLVDNAVGVVGGGGWLRVDERFRLSKPDAREASGGVNVCGDANVQYVNVGGTLTYSAAPPHACRLACGARRCGGGEGWEEVCVVAWQLGDVGACDGPRETAQAIGITPLRHLVGDWFGELGTHMSSTPRSCRRRPPAGRRPRRRRRRTQRA